MKKVFEILDEQIRSLELELEVLRDELDRAQTNDVYNQGPIAHRITLRIAELDALKRFKRRLQREDS
jgi:hypothetical protein